MTFSFSYISCELKKNSTWKTIIFYNLIFLVYFLYFIWTTFSLLLFLLFAQSISFHISFLFDKLFLTANRNFSVNSKNEKLTI